MRFAHPIFRHLACAAMGVALFLTAGGHFAVLQTVAWTTMVSSYSRSGSISEAVEKTFDGRHLCPLCKKIAKARSAEEKAPSAVKLEKKAEVFLVSLQSELPSPVSKPFAYAPAPFVFLLERCDAPPVPVPRDSVS